MKKNSLLLLFLFLPIPTFAVEFEVGMGIGMDVTPGNDFSVAINYYYHKNNLYMQGKTMTNRFTSLNLGFTGYGLHWVMGVGYLRQPEKDSNLTGHRQFNLGLFYDVGPMRFGWDHISNCSKMCWDNKREDLRPNHARDYLMFKYIF